MGFSFTFEIDQDILRVEIRGVPGTEAEWLASWKSVYQALADNGIELVLSDERWSATPARYHEAAIAAAGASKVRPPNARFAIVCAPHSRHLYDYLLDHLNEHDRSVTYICYDIDEAEAWLRA